MAKKNAKKTLDISPKVVGESDVNQSTAPAVAEKEVPPVPAPPVPAQQEGKRTMKTVTVERKSTQKNGVSTYSAEGLNASVYFNQTFWTDKQPPSKLTITVDSEDGTIAAPGTNGKAAASVTPERAQKAAEAAEKSQKLLEKAQARAEKQAKLAAQLKAALGGEQAAQ